MADNNRRRRTVTKKAMQAVAPSLRQLAEDEGLSYSTLKAWSAGVRTPDTEKLAKVLRKRARLLERLAGELERETPEA
jgi:transcriptional regulator with XRE-family HTH domain